MTLDELFSDEHKKAYAGFIYKRFGPRISQDSEDIIHEAYARCKQASDSGTKIETVSFVYKTIRTIVSNPRHRQVPGNPAALRGLRDETSEDPAQTPLDPDDSAGLAFWLAAACREDTVEGHSNFRTHLSELFAAAPDRIPITPAVVNQLNRSTAGLFLRRKLARDDLDEMETRWHGVLRAVLGESVSLWGRELFPPGINRKYIAEETNKLEKDAGWLGRRPHEVAVTGSLAFGSWDVHARMELGAPEASISGHGRSPDFKNAIRASFQAMLASVPRTEPEILPLRWKLRTSQGDRSAEELLEEIEEHRAHTSRPRLAEDLRDVLLQRKEPLSKSLRERLEQAQTEPARGPDASEGFPSDETLKRLTAAHEDLQTIATSNSKISSTFFDQERRAKIVKWLGALGHMAARFSTTVVFLPAHGNEPARYQVAMAFRSRFAKVERTSRCLQDLEQALKEVFNNLGLKRLRHNPLRALADTGVDFLNRHFSDDLEERAELIRRCLGNTD